MISQFIYELSCIPMRFRAWRNRKIAGVERKNYIRIYDYHKRK